MIPMAKPSQHKSLNLLDYGLNSGQTVEVRRNDSAMRYGFKHPLDVDLADFASGLIDDEQRDELEQHLSECLLCRIKLRRLRNTLSEEVSPGGPIGNDSEAAEKVGDWLRFDFPTPRVATVD